MNLTNKCSIHAFFLTKETHIYWLEWIHTNSSPCSLRQRWIYQWLVFQGYFTHWTSALWRKPATAKRKPTNKRQVPVGLPTPACRSESIGEWLNASRPQSALQATTPWTLQNFMSTNCVRKWAQTWLTWFIFRDIEKRPDVERGISLVMEVVAWFVVGISDELVKVFMHLLSDVLRVQHPEGLIAEPTSYTVSTYLQVSVLIIFFFFSLCWLFYVLLKNFFTSVYSRVYSLRH